MFKLPFPVKLRDFYNHPGYLLHRHFPYKAIFNKAYYSEQLLTSLAEIDTILADPKRSTIMKEDNNTLAKIQVGEHSVMVKRHNSKTLWRFIKRMFATSRAVKNWLRAHDLLSLQVATPTPVAIMTKEIGPIKLRSYYIYEYLDAITIEEFFVTCQNEALKKNVAEQIAQTLILLFQKGLCQRDIGITNMLVKDGRLYMIDVEGIVYFRGMTPLKNQLKGLEVFFVHWSYRPDIQNYFKEVFTKAGLTVPVFKC